MTFKERLNREYVKEDEVVANNNNADIQGFDSEYFGIDNIKSYPACVDLRLPEGQRKAMPYSYIAEINYKPNEGIEITTSTKRIKIEGRNLEKLFDYLTAFRVRYIQTSAGMDIEEEGGLFVKEITIEDI